MRWQKNHFEKLFSKKTIFPSQIPLYQTPSYSKGFPTKSNKSLQRFSLTFEHMFYFFPCKSKTKLFLFLSLPHSSILTIPFTRPCPRPADRSAAGALRYPTVAFEVYKTLMIKLSVWFSRHEKITDQFSSNKFSCKTTIFFLRTHLENLKI